MKLLFGKPGLNPRLANIGSNFLRRISSDWMTRGTCAWMQLQTTTHIATSSTLGYGDDVSYDRDWHTVMHRALLHTHKHDRQQQNAHIRIRKTHRQKLRAFCWWQMLPAASLVRTFGPLWNMIRMCSQFHTNVEMHALHGSRTRTRTRVLCNVHAL